MTDEVAELLDLREAAMARLDDLVRSAAFEIRMALAADAESYSNRKRTPENSGGMAPVRDRIRKCLRLLQLAQEPPYQRPACLPASIPQGQQVS
jgi:hypothetical protein